MLLASLLMVVGTASADDLVVSVPTSADRVILQCGEQRYERTVPRSPSPTVDMTFPIRPGRECSVSFVRNAGSLTQFGKWACTETGCTEVEQDIGEVVALPPGHVKLVLSEELAHPMVEMSCPSGYRQRAPVVDHIVLFTDVSPDDCTLNFKGGQPYRYRPVGWGTWACSVISATLVCEQRG